MVEKYKSREISKSLKHKNWIAGAIKKPGALHTALGVKQGAKIPKSKINKAAAGGKGISALTEKRANLAKTLASFHHKEMAEHHKHLAMHHKSLGDMKMHKHHKEMYKHHKEAASSPEHVEYKKC